MKALNILRIIISGFLLIFLGWFVLKDQVDQTNLSKPFVGSGTKADPYLIETAEQFANFRDLVNAGNTYKDCYFLQIADLDLEKYTPWVPIGEFGTTAFFDGYYDGDGHIIKNLTCYYDENVHLSASLGLFGQLAGTVANLGIKNGIIEGICSGSITSHSYTNSDTPPLILNCFSYASVATSHRGGGIADNFSTGYIVNCWYNGAIDSPWIGGIVSYNAGIIFNSASNVQLINDNYAGILLESKQYIDEHISSQKFIDEINSLQGSSETFFELESETCTKWNFDAIRINS